MDFKKVFEFVRSQLPLKQLVAFVGILFLYNFALRSGYLGENFSPVAKPVEKPAEKLPEPKPIDTSNFVMKEDLQNQINNLEIITRLKSQDRRIYLELRNLVDDLKISKAQKKEIYKRLSDLDRSLALQEKKIPADDGNTAILYEPNKERNVSSEIPRVLPKKKIFKK